MLRFRLIAGLLGLAILVSVLALVRGRPSDGRGSVQPQAMDDGQRMQSALSQKRGASEPFPAASQDISKPSRLPQSGVELPASTSLASRFPRGLTEHAALALLKKDGAGAMAVAQALAACGRLRIVLPSAEAALRRDASTEAFSRRAGELAEQQALAALCQTVTPELQRQKRALYALAAQQEVPGAATAYYDARDPQSQTESIVRQVRADAEGGQLMALGALAESSAKASVLSADDVATYRLALTLLSRTPEWGSSAASVIAFIRQERAFQRAMAGADRGDAQQMAAALNGEDGGDLYDLSQVSPQARKNAELLVQRLVAQRR